ncbi:MAG TPA: hypothetical protein VFF96_11595 [Pseudoxanthomonas sp.]|nr:hypothetical protein [Pseudoxanthomonas sp.]
MRISTLITLLVCALALWAFGLWRKGFFSSETPALERRIYFLRIFFWFASIIIVSWPLRNYREQLGDSGYIIAALFTLGLFFLLGVLASKALTKRQ